MLLRLYTANRPPRVCFVGDMSVLWHAFRLSSTFVLLFVIALVVFVLFFVGGEFLLDQIYGSDSNCIWMCFNVFIHYLDVFQCIFSNHFLLSEFNFVL